MSQNTLRPTAPMTFGAFMRKLEGIELKIADLHQRVLEMEEAQAQHIPSPVQAELPLTIKAAAPAPFRHKWTHEDADSLLEDVVSGSCRSIDALSEKYKRTRDGIISKLYEMDITYSGDTVLVDQRPRKCAPRGQGKGAARV